MFGHRVKTTEQAAMKLENSEIFPENSGASATLGSRGSAWCAPSDPDSGVGSRACSPGPGEVWEEER